MEKCKLCLAEIHDDTDSKSDYDYLKTVIETLFLSKIKLDPDLEVFVCENCERMLMEFYEFYLKVLQNQVELEKASTVKTDEEELRECKQECFLIEFPELTKVDEAKRQKNDLRRSPKVKSTTKNSTKRKSKINQQEDNAIKDFFGLKCEKCTNLDFLRFEQLRDHMKTVHAVFKFGMRCCSRTFYKRCYIYDHVVSHIAPEKLRCTICEKQTINLRSYRAHMKQHEGGEMHCCDLCQKSFYTKAQLKAHLKVHLSAEEKEKLKIHRCDTCGSGFAQKSLLIHHIRQTHQSVYACICDICAKVFSTKMGFLTHFKHVHGKPELNQVQCQICGKYSANELSLRKHVKRNHSKGPHICRFCKKEVKSLSTLIAHERYTHQATRKFQCEYCSKAFKRPLTLKEHLTTHLGGVLYSCTYCEKTFNSGANMYSHRKKLHPIEWERDRSKH